MLLFFQNLENSFLDLGRFDICLFLSRGHTHITGGHFGGDTHITSDMCAGTHISWGTHITVTPVPIYTPGWRGTMRVKCLVLGLKPGVLTPELRALTMRPPPPLLSVCQTWV